MGIEPTTVGADVTRACTTPQTLKSFPYFPTSLLHRFLHVRTPVARIRQRRIASSIQRREKFREELAFTESGFKPKYRRWACSAKEPWTSPSRDTNPVMDCFGSKRLRRFALELRVQAVVHETRSPWYHSVLAFVFVSHSLLSRSVRFPGDAKAYD